MTGQTQRRWQATACVARCWRHREKAMTDAEWLASTDPYPMLLHLGDQASSRKLRLYGCAWGYSAWDRLTDERSRQAILTAERFADRSRPGGTALRFHRRPAGVERDARGVRIQASQGQQVP